jgi:pimeloyl-ACP methyl ester carboxylesterase
MLLAGKWQRPGGTLSSELGQSRLEAIRVNDRWVDVARLGRGQPIVLVPGLAGSWKLVVPLAHRLATGFEVFACGLRDDRLPSGALHAAVRRASDIGDYASDLACVIETLGLERPLVFGVSFGGAIALEFAAEYPQRLSGLILQGAEARFRTTIGSTIARLVLERFPLPSDSHFVNQFSHLLYGGRPEPGPLVDYLVDRIWETDQSVMAQRLALLESFDIRDRLWRIDVPTLVLAGARDVIVPAQDQRALAAGISSARFELIESAGHVAFLTHRREVDRRVRRHLRRVASGRRG